MTNFYGDEASSMPTRNIGGWVMQWNPDSNRYDIDLGPIEGSSLSPDVYFDAQGHAYRWDGTRDVAVPQFDDPTQAAGYVAPPRTSYSYSSSTSQSFQDPAALQIQRDSLAEQIRQNIAAEARDMERLSLERDKARVAEEQGNKSLALQSSQLAETIQARIQSNALDRQKLQQDLTLFDRQIAANKESQAQQQAFEAGQAREGRQFTAQQNAQDRALSLYQSDVERESREQQAAREDARLRASQAADFAANGATDFGKLSSFLGNGGLSGISTAIGQGQSAITDQSLEPLAALLAPAPEVRKAKTLNDYMALLAGTGGEIGGDYGDRDYSQHQTTPEEAEAFARLFAESRGETYVPSTQQQTFTAQSNAAAPVPSPAPDPFAAMKAMAEKQGKQLGEFEDGGAVVSPGILNGLMGLVKALGMEPKAIAGERGKANGETVYSNGDVVVVPDKGKGGGKAPKMEFGGGVISQTLARARQYQEQAGAEALRRAGLTDTLAPVALSDPGTDPTLQDLGASIAAVTRGIPRASFLNELMKITPTAMLRGSNRRTY